ncbi:uncharacterized protein LOC125656245 [Ostrea edulis]|uniref:uncharacterized protein LOC125656245 n=1 Tax=Ostrea edulis TaxID=37623 RepID=UPI00209477F0|nr:uncharacterized protein LOC125656245 [Ostrea edulis]
MEDNGRLQPGTVFESTNLKHEAENELLVKLGAKEEEFDWHPDILYRRPERPRSSISLDYPLDLKVGRPKTGNAIQNRNPWICNNQAMRQITLVTRHGPRQRFLNRAQFSAGPVSCVHIHKSIQ